jgi:hypothetical protein
MLNLYGIVAAIFENGDRQKSMAAKTRHKIWEVKIQHFPISSKFDIWVDYDVPNLFPTLKIF